MENIGLCRDSSDSALTSLTNGTRVFKQIALIAIQVFLIGSAEAGRILNNGPVAIKLNAEPVTLVNSMPKIGYNSSSTEERKPSADFRFSDEQIAFAARNCRMIRKVSGEVFGRLLEVNPRLIKTQYMASTYLKGHETGWTTQDVERKLRFYLAMTPAAKLDSDIDEKVTKFRVVAYTQEMLTSVGATTKDGSRLPAGIAIYASTTDAEISQSFEEFVFWVRVDNELMRVCKWDPKTGTITVARGFDGTKAAAHSRGAVVTSPLMAGSSANTRPKDRALPFGNTRLPKKPKDGGSYQLFAYVIDKRADCGPAFEIKAQHVVEMMTQKGLDGACMDVMTANVPMFNMADCFGRKAKSWNFETNAPYTVFEWITGHNRQLGFMQRYCRARTGRWPYLQANGVSAQDFSHGQGEGGYCKRLLLADEFKERPLDGYNTEKGLAAVGEQFPQQFKMLQTCMQERLNVVFCLKAPTMANDAAWYNRQMLYGMAMYYLGYEFAANRHVGRGPYLSVNFLSAWYQDGIGPAYRGRSGLDYKVGLPYPLYLPLGKPTKNAKPGEVDAYRYKNTNILMRPFENGLVLINPTGRGFGENEASVDVDLEQLLKKQGQGSLNIPLTYKVELGRRYIDCEIGQYVTKLEMGPCTGKILLTEPGS